MKSRDVPVLGSNSHYFKLVPKKDGTSKAVGKHDYLDSVSIFNKLGYDVLDSGYSKGMILVSLDKPIDPEHMKELRHTFQIEEDDGDGLCFRNPYGVARQFLLTYKTMHKEVEIGGMKAIILCGFENLPGKIVEEEHHMVGRIIGLKEEGLDKPNWFKGELLYRDGSELGGNLYDYNKVRRGSPSLEKTEGQMKKIFQKCGFNVSEVGNLDYLNPRGEQRRSA